MSTSGSPPLPRSVAPWLELARLFLLALLATLTVVTLIFLARRVSGALVTPLEFLPALALGLLLAVGTWLLRRLSAWVVSAKSLSTRLLHTITVITWLLLIGITLSKTSPLAILGMWLPMIAAECVWRVRPHESGPIDSAVPVVASHHIEPPDAPLPGSGVVQNLIRTREADREVVSGVISIDFAAGEQTTALHLVFSPSLVSDPEVEVEADEADVSVRATDCRSYGVRIEAKRGRDTIAPLSVYAQLQAVSRAT